MEVGLTNIENINVAKIIEVLSVCPPLQELMFMALIKKYEKKSIVSTKYFYEIYLHMKKENNIYKLIKSNFYFLQNIDISSNIKNKTIENLNRSVDINNSKNIWHDSLIALILLYYKSTYKYLFIPIIADYSIDTGLYHQCALLVNFTDKIFLFYEPYGEYSKYEASYIPAVVEFLSEYKFPDIFYENNKLRFDSWHHYFGLKTGIQTILLNQNNNNKEQFDKEKQIYINSLKPDVANKIKYNMEINKNKPINKYDYTMDTMYIIQYFNNIDWSNIEDENKALELYYKYNSKTCVTITLIELDFYFNLSEYSYNKQKEKLKLFYNDFTNIKLINCLNEFINTSLNKEKMKKIMENRLNRICDKI
jgi:hypothetical protein